MGGGGGGEGGRLLSRSKGFLTHFTITAFSVKLVSESLTFVSGGGYWTPLVKNPLMV